VAANKNGRDLSGIEHAGFWIRFAAWLIDGIILSVAGFPLGAILGATGASPALFWVLTPINPAYVVGFWAVKGATPGKMIVGVEILTVDGERIGLGQSVLRYVGYIVSSLLLLTGYLMIGFTKEKRGLHDYIAGTVVVGKRLGSTRSVTSARRMPTTDEDEMRSMLPERLRAAVQKARLLDETERRQLRLELAKLVREGALEPGRLAEELEAAGWGADPAFDFAESVVREARS
jgi:uncharacterized RDD family membrane protein YckC